jgi:hypothetical protein
MTTYTATYSPDDNKLRLYARTRLDAETYARVKADGFKWAPKQQLFVAPMWTPGREDLLVELAGEIDDDDSSLVERAEERAERFDDYSDKRAADADTARKAVDRIADGIPLGQPILVGHHSERHARKDAERIESGMRKAVKMWETSKYWQARAAGALRHAKYKELPAVRHRRIKTIEADKRKADKTRQEADMWLKLWTECGNEADSALQFEVAKRIANMCWLHLPRKEGDRPDFDGAPTAYDAVTNSHPTLYAPRAVAEIVEHAKRVYPATIARCERWIAHYDNRLIYERAMLAEQLGADATTDNAMAARFDLKPGGRVLVDRDRWVTILRVNKAQGIVNSVTTVAPPEARAWAGRWKYGIEKIQDYQPPTEETAAKVKKATTLPPLCNYPGDGFREMTDAEWKARKKWSDFPYIGSIKATDMAGRHRVRQMPKPGACWEKQQVFITDAKRVDPPAPEPKAEPIACEPLPMVGYTAPQPRLDDPKDAEFRALKNSLRTGVQVVPAPQLFPTPAELAARAVRLAEIEDGHRVLEPSAGTGALLRAIPAGAACVAVEINPGLADRLRRAEYAATVHCGDFLDFDPPAEPFDRVVMNPPFANGADIKHITHALGFLKPGGRLVAICANGPRQREQLKPLASEWQDLPAGTFKEQGTGVNAALLVIER